jgi:hypothetical protein
MGEVELSGHVCKQPILRDKDKLFVDVFEALYLVVHLHENGFRRHLPVHAEGFIRFLSTISARDAKLFEKPLAFRPNGSGCIERLKFYTDKIPNPVLPYRNEKEVNASARNRDLGNKVQFIAGFMGRQQMEAISEYLAALDEARRADDDWFLSAAIKNRAAPDGDAGVTLPNLVAALPKEWTFLPLDDSLPILSLLTA